MAEDEAVKVSLGLGRIRGIQVEILPELPGTFSLLSLQLYKNC